MLGDEDIAQNQAATAGAAHAEGVPVVDDFDVGHRHGQQAWLLVARCILAARADNGPLGVQAAARERIASA